MGTCWGSPVENQSTCTTRPSTPGTLENKKISQTGDSSSNQKGKVLEKPKVKVYTFAELKAATKNFRPDAILGEGSFGKVYKGWVDEKTYAPSKPGVGMVVAVKKLKPDRVQGMDEWQSEVNFLGRFSHPNLIKLIGYCGENKYFLLVYEFMQKGSLDNHLFRRGSVVEPLSWSSRLKIALGAARGLAFLHDSQNQVIYRDFKASHILLDGEFNAKLSDFGLAKNGPADGDSHVSTRVVGTSGYAAPEYLATGHLYVKSDVYVFGVVLLEMLTGLRALDRSRTDGQLSLMDWAKPLLADRRKLLPIMDSRLNEKYPVKGAVQAGQLTQKCLGLDPRSRPSMKEVVEALEQIQCISEESKESGSFSKHATGHRNGRNTVYHRSPLASSRG